MKRLLVVGVVAGLVLSVTPAQAGEPNPQTRRACEDFVDWGLDTQGGIGSALTAREARKLLRAFEKKGVPKALKRTAREWFEHFQEAVKLPLAAYQAIDILDRCERQGVRL